MERLRQYKDRFSVDEAHIAPSRDAVFIVMVNAAAGEISKTVWYSSSHVSAHFTPDMKYSNKDPEQRASQEQD